MPTGVNQQTGQMAVPGNVRDVAWYEFGSRPGEEGQPFWPRMLIWPAQGPGVFFNLRTSMTGDIVEVEFSDGSFSVFRVQARTVYQKDSCHSTPSSPERVRPVLTLITCGGGFSESSGSYDSNVVVYAVPIAGRDLGSVG